MLRHSLVLSLLAACSASGLTADLDGGDASDRAILAGAPLDWVPGGVRIYSGPNAVCTGMLVSPTEVVTAAHCVVGQAVTVCPSASPVSCALPLRTTVHPEYMSGVDLAVLRMGWDGASYTTYELPSAPVAEHVLEDPVTLYGFGPLAAGGAPVAARIDVDAVLRRPDQITVTGGALPGDDGGGLVAERGEHAFLLGVTVGLGEVEPLAPELDWLVDTLQGETVFYDDHPARTPFVVDQDVVLEGALYSTDVDSFDLDLRIPATLTVTQASDMPIRIGLDGGRSLGDELRAGRYTLNVEGWWGMEAGDYLVHLGLEPAGEPVPDLVITEVYGGAFSGGCLSATNFVEVVNVGTAPVDLEGLQLAYTLNAVNGGRHHLLYGVLAPGGALLFSPGPLDPCSPFPPDLLVDAGTGAGPELLPDSRVSLVRGSDVVDSLQLGPRQRSRVRLTPSRFDPGVLDASTPGRAPDGRPWSDALSTCDTVYGGLDSQLASGVLGDDTIQPSCTASAGGDSVVSWVTPGAGCFRFDTVGSDFDTVLTRQGSCVATDELACNDDVGQGVLTSSLDVQAEAGERIVLGISAYGSATGTWTLNVSSCD